MKITELNTDCPDCGYSTVLHYYEETTKRIWSGPKSTFERTHYCDSLRMRDLVKVVEDDIKLSLKDKILKKLFKK